MMGSPGVVMESVSDARRRRSIRLKEHDYSQAGAYFITICTQNRELLLDDTGVRSMVQRWWDALPTKFPSVRTDQFIVMPNHVHGIVLIPPAGADPVRADQRVCPNDGQPHRIAPTFGKIVQWFKRTTTNDYIKAVRQGSVEPFAGRLWQRNYYEHIVRIEGDLDSTRQYILDNPAKWEEDKENPVNTARNAKRRASSSRK